ncbi:MAG: hypothetical protein WBA46_06370 [Thermomicrobiales bacterium]
MSEETLKEHVIDQGEPFSWWFAVRYPDGEVADLIADGYPHARFVVIPAYGEDPVIDVSDADYIHVERVYDAPAGDPGRMQWSGYIEIPASITAALSPWGRGLYELRVENGAGDFVPVDKGTAILERKVIP